MNQELRHKRAGFSLIELLVVIAIIAVLIGLLLPAVQQVREAANRTRCLSNMKQLATAVQAFHLEHGSLPTYNGVFPAVGANTLASANTKAIYGGWFVHLMPFVEQGNLYDRINDDVTQRSNTLGTVSYPATGTLVPAVATRHAPQDTTGHTYIPGKAAMPATYKQWDAIKQVVSVPTLKANGYTIYVDQFQPAKFPDPGTGIAAVAARWVPPLPPRVVIAQGNAAYYVPANSGPVIGHIGVMTPEISSQSFTILQCPSDPSSGTDPQSNVKGRVYTGTTAPWGSTNYLANWQAFTNGDATKGYTAPPRSLDQISDGSSNTIFFAEAYAWCDGRGRTAFFPWHPTHGGVHNFGLTYALTNNTVEAGEQSSLVTSPNGAPNPTSDTFNLGFQVQPLAKAFANCPAGRECCSNLTVQTGHQVLCVAMGDGSVRTISRTLQPDTWRQAVQPSDGETLGSDW